MIVSFAGVFHDHCRERLAVLTGKHCAARRAGVAVRPMDLPGPYPGPSHPMLAAQLRLASEASHRLVFEYLAKRGFSDLRQSHFDLFRFPGPHGRTPTQLAEHMGLSKQALNPLLNELQAMGYLTRGTTDRDKRTRILTLTQRGLDLVAAIREALELLEARTHDQLGPQRYRTLLNALAGIQALPNSRPTQQIG